MGKTELSGVKITLDDVAAAPEGDCEAKHISNSYSLWYFCISNIIFRNRVVLIIRSPKGYGKNGMALYLPCDDALCMTSLNLQVLFIVDLVKLPRAKSLERYLG